AAAAAVPMNCRRLHALGDSALFMVASAGRAAVSRALRLARHSLTAPVPSARLRPMLDTVIANGTVVTPQGAGLWEVGIKGEQIVAVALPGSLPREGARIIDAAGKIVVPGRIDPHTHLAHAIMS